MAETELLENDLNIAKNANDTEHTMHTTPPDGVSTVGNVEHVAVSQDTTAVRITPKMSITRVVTYSRTELLRIREAMKLSFTPVSLPRATGIAVAALGLEALPTNDMNNSEDSDKSHDNISGDNLLPMNIKYDGECTITVISNSDQQTDKNVEAEHTTNTLDTDVDLDTTEIQARDQTRAVSGVLRSASLRKAEWRSNQNKDNQAMAGTHLTGVLNSGHTGTDFKAPQHNTNSQYHRPDSENKNMLQRTVSMSSNDSTESVNEKRVNRDMASPTSNEPASKPRSALKRRNVSPMKAKPNVSNILSHNSESSRFSTTSSVGNSDHVNVTKDETKPPPGPKRRQKSAVTLARLTSVTSHDSSVSSPESSKSVTFAKNDLVASPEGGRSVTFAANQGTMTVQLHNDNLRQNVSAERSSHRTFMLSDKPPGNKSDDTFAKGEVIPTYAVIDTSVATHSSGKDNGRSTANNDSREVTKSNSKPHYKKKLYTDLRNTNKVRTEWNCKDADNYSHVSEDNEQWKKSHSGALPRADVVPKATKLQRSRSLHDKRSKDTTSANNTYLDDLDSVYSSYHLNELESGPRQQQRSSKQHQSSYDEYHETYNAGSTKQRHSNERNQVKRSKSFGKQKENWNNTDDDRNLDHYTPLNGAPVQRAKSLRENRSQKHVSHDNCNSSAKPNYVDSTSDEHGNQSRSFLKAKGGRSRHVDKYNKPQHHQDYDRKEDVYHARENKNPATQTARTDYCYKSQRGGGGARPNRSNSFHEANSKYQNYTNDNCSPVDAEDSHTIKMVNEFYDQLYSAKEPEAIQQEYGHNDHRSKSAPRTRIDNAPKYQSNHTRRPASPDKALAYKVVTDTASTQKRHLVRLVEMKGSTQPKNPQHTPSVPDQSNNPWANFKNVDATFIAKGAAPPVFQGSNRQSNIDQYDGPDTRSRRRRRTKLNNPPQSSPNVSSQDDKQRQDVTPEYVDRQTDEKSARAARNALRRRRQRQKKRIASASAHVHDGYDGYDSDDN